VERRENVDYLPQVPLPQSVDILPDLGAALSGTDVVFVACPAQAIRETCIRASTQWPKPSPVRLVISLAKGLEAGTHLRPSEVIRQVFPRLVVGSLTGPTNAREVALGKPAAMVLAGASHDGVGRDVQQALSSATLRIYTSDDLAGAEFGGCLKNIYAIAAGCCDGLRLGDNTKAALLTRALSEMVRVGVGLGAKAETFHGLSGFGDLVATCYGEWSRNHEFGKQIGLGRSVGELLANRRTVVEGYKTTEAFAGLCAARGLDAPILREVHAILFAGKAPLLALDTLLPRELKGE
jgi:glycerol-3-phosphate dehydrogenase (NAD(P)+)